MASLARNCLMNRLGFKIHTPQGTQTTPTDQIGTDNSSARWHLNLNVESEGERIGAQEQKGIQQRQIHQKA